MSLTNTTAMMIPNESEMKTMKDMARLLADSGMIPAHLAEKPGAVFAIIQKGRELSVPPMYATNNINVIQGKAIANSELMLALIFRDHGDAAIHFAHTDAERCTIEYKRRGGKVGTFTYTMQEAETAGHTKGRNAETWRKYPANMLRARCISAVARMAFPDSIGGMYTAEELDLPITEDGDVIHEPVRAAVTPPRALAAASPAAPPERAAPLSAPRIKGTAQPNGPDVQRQRLIDAAAKKGVLLHPDADAVAWAGCLDDVFERLGMDFRTAASADGIPTARDIHAAILALPTPRAVDAETGEVLDGEARDEPDEYAEVAAATDAGRTLPLVKE